MGLLEEKLTKHPFYALAKEVKEKGVYPYFREIEGKQGTEVEMGGHHVLMCYCTSSRFGWWYSCFRIYSQ